MGIEFNFQDPQHRPTTDDLLIMPFIRGDLDSKPIKDLLLEYKAEVVEEEVVDEEAEVISIIFVFVSSVPFLIMNQSVEFFVKFCFMLHIFC